MNGFILNYKTHDKLHREKISEDAIERIMDWYSNTDQKSSEFGKKIITELRGNGELYCDKWRVFSILRKKNAIQISGEIVLYSKYNYQ